MPWYQIVATAAYVGLETWLGTTPYGSVLGALYQAIFPSQPPASQPPQSGAK